ncbi:hypothetical protein CON35_25550 [Bacillus cereus]|nr:hypothetical protein CON35_25550 [Bacillus cereus]
MSMRIIIGADPVGFVLKNAVKDSLQKESIVVTDITETDDVDYYSVGFEVGKAISEGKYDLGFMFCGTGMGVNIVANKFNGVYSALCESVETAALSRKINNANVLAMGGMIVTPYLAKKMVKAFMETEFSYGLAEADPSFLQSAYKTVQNLEPKITQYNVEKNNTE